MLRTVCGQRRPGKVPSPDRRCFEPTTRSCASRSVLWCMPVCIPLDPCTALHCPASSALTRGLPGGAGVCRARWAMGAAGFEPATSRLSRALPVQTGVGACLAPAAHRIKRRADREHQFQPPDRDLGISLLAGVLSVGVGAGGAWWLHRRTRLSPRNAYLLWVACCPLVVAAAAPLALGGALWLLLASQTASVLGRRWRIAALGAGGELRDHERARVMVWTALRQRDAHGSELIHIAGQGELVPRRGWPDGVRALPMTGDGRARYRSRKAIIACSARRDGGGKTTSARRVLLARGLGEPSVALLALDARENPCTTFGCAQLRRQHQPDSTERGGPYRVCLRLSPHMRDAPERWEARCCFERCTRAASHSGTVLGAYLDAVSHRRQARPI